MEDGSNLAPKGAFAPLLNSKAQSTLCRWSGLFVQRCREKRGTTRASSGATAFEVASILDASFDACTWMHIHLFVVAGIADQGG